VIVCDEAHRLRETSNDRFTAKARRSEISQACEIVRAARVSVFLLDERQSVRPGEIGTVEEIRSAAVDEGAEVREVSLKAQFRCNGCNGYIEWVDALMGEQPQHVGPWLQTEEYDLRLFDNPATMEAEIKQRATGGASARLVAGFCWPWSDPLPGGALAPDVKIGNWRRAWNEKSPEQHKKPGPAPRPDRHPYYLWATRPERIAEIGCIYSAQGFEFDYCGVILGNDLVWRDGVGWVASRDASADPAIKRTRFAEGALERLLQHTYRVLLTRGMRGTFVYSTDYETRELLRSLIAR
jgi:hypothetical protein